MYALVVNYSYIRKLNLFQKVASYIELFIKVSNTVASCMIIIVNNDKSICIL